MHFFVSVFSFFGESPEIIFLAIDVKNNSKWLIIITPCHKDAIIDKILINNFYHFEIILLNIFS